MEKCRRFVGGTHAVLALLALVTAIEALRAAAAEGTESTTLSDFSNDLQRSCPLAMPDVYSKVAPAGKLHANYTKVDGPANFDQCFKACCEDKGCNAAFMYLNESTFICYKVRTITLPAKVSLRAMTFAHSFRLCVSPMKTACRRRTSRRPTWC